MPTVITGPVGQLRPGHRFTLAAHTGPKPTVYTLISVAPNGPDGEVDMTVRRLPEGDTVHLTANVSTPVRVLDRSGGDVPDRPTPPPNPYRAVSADASLLYGPRNARIWDEGYAAGLAAGEAVAVPPPDAAGDDFAGYVNPNDVEPTTEQVEQAWLSFHAAMSSDDDYREAVRCALRAGMSTAVAVPEDPGTSFSVEWDEDRSTTGTLTVGAAVPDVQTHWSPLALSVWVPRGMPTGDAIASLRAALGAGETGSPTDAAADGADPADPDTWADWQHGDHSEAGS